MPVDHREVAFESAIEDYLLKQGGYIKGDLENFDKDRCLDSTEDFDFLCFSGGVLVFR